MRGMVTTMNGRYVTEEMINEARQVDLLSYLKAHQPTNLVRCGPNEYCTAEHDSLKISNGKWFWFSRGVGGNSALDYLVRVEGIDFVSAVSGLATGSLPRLTRPERSEPKRRDLSLPRMTFDLNEAGSYLRSRCIDQAVINDFTARKMVAEDTLGHTVLFLGLDKNNKPRQCSMRSSSGPMVKRDATGSDKSYCFSSPAESQSRTLRVFEGAIDLLSFATLMREAGVDYRKTHMISLSGINLPGRDLSEVKAPVCLQRYLDDHPEIQNVVLHLDNDYAGRRASVGIQYALEKQGFTVKTVPPPHGKDFNDYLIYVQNLKRIKRGNQTNHEYGNQKLQRDSHSDPAPQGRCGGHEL